MNFLWCHELYNMKEVSSYYNYFCLQSADLFSHDNLARNIKIYCSWKNFRDDTNKNFTIKILTNSVFLKNWVCLISRFDTTTYLFSHDNLARNIKIYCSWKNFRDDTNKNFTIKILTNSVFLKNWVCLISRFVSEFVLFIFMDWKF